MPRYENLRNVLFFLSSAVHECDVSPHIQRIYAPLFRRGSKCRTKVLKSAVDERQRTGSLLGVL